MGCFLRVGDQTTERMQGSQKANEPQRNKSTTSDKLIARVFAFMEYAVHWHVVVGGRVKSIVKVKKLEAI